MRSALISQRMMVSSTRCLVCLAAVMACWLGAGCRRADGQAAGTPRAEAPKARRSPYDVAPMLRSLRPGQKRQIERQLGLKGLDELPFYDIDLALDAGGGRLAGSYLLHYRNPTGKPLRVLPLLLHPNAPRELGVKSAAELRVVSAQVVDGSAATVEELRPTLVNLQLASPLARDAWLKLRVRFEGRLRRLPADSNDIFSQALSSLGVGSSGSGASDYGLLATGDGLTTVASAYPMVAPFAEGQFDLNKPTKFGDLAYNQLVNFRVRIAVPAGHTIVTNLVELPGEKRLDSGQRVFTAVGAANRDFVLVAGKQLQRKTRRVGPIAVNSVYLARDRAAGGRMLETGAEALALFEKRFGPYPYTEMDLAEATLVGGAGGVEFPGMVLVAGMLYRKPSQSNNPLAVLSQLMGNLGQMLGGNRGGGAAANASIDQVMEMMGRFVTAHEVAHQYFAGLVGSDCRRHPAVDEPIAQFAAGEYMVRRLGAAEGKRATDLNVKANYGIYRMLGGKDMPAAQPVDSFPNALAYAALVYGKAPYYYSALRAKIGRRRFDRALRFAVDRHRYRLISLDDWIRALRDGAGGSPEVEQLARRYFRESHGDEDLGVDESGDAVLELLLGKQIFAQFKQGLGQLGMHPRSLFRMLMGKMAQGSGPPQGDVDPFGVLRQLERLRK